MQSSGNRLVIAYAAAGAGGLWVTLLMAAPLMAASAPGLAGLMYALGSLICHQRPERSFHLLGYQLPVCARCFGLYAGGAAGLAAWCLHARRRRVDLPRGRALPALIVASLPTIGSVAAAWLSLGDPANPWRALLALPLGAAAGIVAGAAITDHLK